MKRRNKVSLVLVLCLLWIGTLSTGCSAQRTTNFFVDQPHSDLHYSQMEYVRPDTTVSAQLITQIESLLDTPSNAAQVEQLYNQLEEEITQLSTMYTLADLYISRDGLDPDWMEESNYCYSAYLTVYDNLSSLCQQLLNSPCGDFLRDRMPETVMEEFLEYQPMTQEQFALSDQEQTLVSEYQAASLTSFTTQYQGQIWTEDDVYTAYYEDDTIDYDTMITLLDDLGRRQAQQLGDIYLRLVQVRKQLSTSYGYDSYADYAYEEVYDRTYTPQEIRGFHQAVKQHIALPNYQLSDLAYYNDDPVLTQAFTWDEVFSQVSSTLPRMSSELVESWSYMAEHGLYDLDAAPNKLDVGFTTLIPSCNAPFLFLYPYGDLSDFEGMVHEFGHYNAFYWQPSNWWDLDLDIDMAEVHSQGMELLFAQHYPKLFGSSAQTVQTHLMYNLADSLVDGCLQDELQQFVYEQPDLTVEQINMEYARLLKEYHVWQADDPRTQAYDWVAYSHTFETPFYYISYAVSAAGAFELWTQSLTDYGGALDLYLQLVSLGMQDSFLDNLSAVGLKSPLTDAYIAQLAQDLERELQISQRWEQLRLR